MGLDLINSHVAKIILAIEEGDSINQVSRKTGGSYGWTHQWVERLEEINVIERDRGIQIKDDEFAQDFEDLAKMVLEREIDYDDAYLLPNFSGLEYRYSHTDAVYIWTEGGYQIGRNQDDYPIFIDVLEDDINEWQAFFNEFSLESNIEERIQDGEPGIYYVLFPREEFESAWSDSASVMPLDETVEWAKKYEVNFQPALEMLDKMYDLELGVEYRERNVMEQ